MGAARFLHVQRITGSVFILVTDGTRRPGRFYFFRSSTTDGESERRRVVVFLAADSGRTSVVRSAGALDRQAARVWQPSAVQWVVSSRGNQPS